MSDKFYYIDGRVLNELLHSPPLHRVDGPAIDMAGGYKAWYLNDVQYSEEDFNKLDKSQWMVNKIEVNKVMECIYSSRDLFAFGCKCDYSKK